jgi:transketolase
MKINNLEKMAKNIRGNCLEMVHSGKSSHIGAALSCVDILTVLYGTVIDTLDLQDPNRDIFILSKGHAGVALYATLAEFGYFDKALLSTHYQNGAKLSGHVSHVGVRGVEFSTGSLGHGLPVAAGIALAKKKSGFGGRAIVLLGDGEVMEGSNWEALLFSAHQNLDNLIVIIDRNNLQSFTTTEKTVALESLEDKFKAFNCYVEIIDGHDLTKIEKSIKNTSTDRPNIIIANTIKGKGVSYMENKVEWHYKFPDEAELALALDELGIKK